jgi:NADPH:quinone reductase-like Zn-dependent oxidoreductase
VTAICSARNADFVQRLGADAVIDYTRGDMEEQLKQAVGRRGVFDLCFDTVSSLDEKVNSRTL